MRIYLMQHGLAVPEQENPVRPLSPAGREQIEASARALAKLETHVELIVSSPKQRAVETARIVAGHLGYKPDSVLETETLLPKAAPESAIAFLSRYKDRNTILVAGHLPSLARIASHLLTGGKGLDIHFDNGGLCLIEIEDLPDYHGSLCWYLRHEHLQLIAATP